MMLRQPLPALLLVAVTLLGACGRGAAAEVPGVSDDAVTIGTTVPLSGPASSSGAAMACGLEAYFDAVNDDGGVVLADGARRRIEFLAYDDGYDPARALQNYERLVHQDDVFALVSTFGTAPSQAIMQRAAADEVPQVFVHSGAALFSGDDHPWTTGWQPTYQAEGEAYGRFLAEQGEPLTVAVLSQNDDLGNAYVEGFEAGIAGSDVRIVATETYEPSDATVDSQMASLAASEADAFLSAVAIHKLQAGALTAARQLGWDPTVLLISLAASKSEVLGPADALETGDIYTVGFVKPPDNAQWAADPDLQAYLERVAATCPDVDPATPNAQWGYATAATFVRALGDMDALTRSALMDAVGGVEGSVDLLLPGVEVDASAPGPPVQGFRLQQLVDGEWRLLDP